MDDQRTVTVIGAGIVGLCCARALQRRGRRVTVIDSGEPGRGTSYGNAGILSAGSVLPEGHPGLWKRLPGLLLDRQGPLTIRPGYLPQMLPWLLRFMANTTPGRAEAISKALATIVLPSVEHYMALLDDVPGDQVPIRRQGCLYLYPRPQDVKAAEPDNAARKRRGVAVEILGPDEVRQLIPALGPDMAGGALATQSGHATSPLALSQLLAAQIESAGGTFVRAEVSGFTIGADGPSHVRTDQGEIAIEDVVIAAGAFSKPLAAALGNTVPLDTERGYHMMLPQPQIEIRVPMLISSLGFGVTPMDDGLRLAGTVEFGGLKAPPDYRRADIILAHAKRLFPDLGEEGAEPWMGHRPSMPDSLPVISRSSRFDRVFYAFGHGHLGLSLGAVTGRLIADLVEGRPSDIDPAPFRADRF
ncbi:MAG: FAD-binding oxidoreductase [Rhodospirillaceae bacterium]|jgi:glycine/D-amino acid oxidase-like deaminating enzyme|nr:FAD-binding oxidoreductase [Rhodospirillaceae bacterium]MBT5193707.1 FAD-binding oxidoreductase [Rhodospirillaceae bacterium]MBT5894854.1 FAD-binding oxidoreductase [Rhodospirillaceae bacterium]MBT6431420.1 FAD-binding oxidoreductase [Rhodospirillaceae bacterium]MBT7760784.1 FAD-binding oxidoreductase [Rhodospirillaceae bacterium]